MSLGIVALGALCLPSPASGHGGGVLDLNACVQIGGPGKRYTAHLDLFQGGEGPWCDEVPRAGKEVSVVFDLRGDLSSVPIGFRLFPQDPARAEDAASVLLDIEPEIHRSGVVAREVVFEHPGVYEAHVELPDGSFDLVFLIWVETALPWSRRLERVAFEVIERPYAILFVLFVSLGAGAFYFSRGRKEVPA